jgi:SAM-dependent methyltransferase
VGDRPVRIQLSRAKGWRLPADAVSVARPGRFGNPFRVEMLGAELAVEMFRDMVNALAALRGQPQFEHGEFSAIQRAYELGEDAVLDGRSYTEPARYPHERDRAYPTVNRGLTVRRFQNGNAHIFFDAEALLAVNRALAEFYGEVLPDVEPEDVKPSASTAISKDLQFYWTPPAVALAALDFADLYGSEHYRRGEMPERRVLEPSCGDGRILDELRMRGCKALGIEYHPGRASEARAKGHAVVTGNFLDHPPAEEFDAVVMNPPFYGRHYAKHVRHAYKFLRPGGVLVAILPATARYDHGELDGDWRDLPVASFADAGTNVPTTMLKMRKSRS